MVEYMEAIKRPFSDIKKLLIGILLAIIPIINFFSYGFILESIKTTKKKNMPLPEWKNWGQLFLKGVLYMVIGVLYAIPGLILIMVGAGGFLMTLFQQGVLGGETMGYEAVTSAMTAGGGFGAIAFIGILWFILVAYLVPVAVINFVNKNKFSDAFEFKKIFKKAFTGKYFVNWLIAVLIYIIIVGVASILNMIPVIGQPIGSAFATFVGGMTYLTILAQTCAEIK